MKAKTMVVLLLLCCQAAAGNPSKAQPGDQSDKANQVQELPAELVGAWTKAGARVGWMGDQFDLYLVYRQGLSSSAFRDGAAGKKARYQPSVSPRGRTASQPSCRNRRRHLVWTSSTAR